jgi:hypothetical protein
MKKPPAAVLKPPSIPGTDRRRELGLFPVLYFPKETNNSNYCIRLMGLL